MRSGVLLHVCRGAIRGKAKQEVERLTVVPSFGAEGDAHAGPSHGPLCLLAQLDLDYMQARGLRLAPGALGEHLALSGIDTEELGVGTQLRIGSVLLELTQIGTICRTRCSLYRKAGDCIMPRTALLARVVEGGELSAGMPVDVTVLVPRCAIQAALVMVAGDPDGAAAQSVTRLLREQLGAYLPAVYAVPGKSTAIAARLRELCDRRLDLVLTIGGTGLDPQALTPNATRGILEYEVPGIPEAMRALGRRSTPHAILARGLAGVRRQCLVINLPGSECAAVECLSAVMAALPHAVQMLRNCTRHPQKEPGRQALAGCFDDLRGEDMADPQPWEEGFHHA